MLLVHKTLSLTENWCHSPKDLVDLAREKLKTCWDLESIHVGSVTPPWERTSEWNTSYGAGDTDLFVIRFCYFFSEGVESHQPVLGFTSIAVAEKVSDQKMQVQRAEKANEILLYKIKRSIATAMYPKIVEFTDEPVLSVDIETDLDKPGLLHWFGYRAGGSYDGSQD